ncbi:exosortase V [Sphingopyxis sp.]|uniref:exosortase V n=1 Tax=Sphingopyxis sp. TaxID=1908224 RepID=UPI0010F65D9F|nr:exosortase V [Sphingopyxis sp.]MBR2173603.1 exosortase V [Sphingopyxis sp.]
MATAADIEARPGLSGPFARKLSAGTIALAIGVLIFSVPTMLFVVRQSWTGEEGAHGPIVLVTGLWLLYRRWKEISHLAVPAASAPVWIVLAVLIPMQIFTRITQIVEIEGYLMYAILLVILYSLVGLEAMKKLWFPLFYLAFIFPPPETVVAFVTVPMKIWLSEAAIWFLDIFGYPIGGEGVRIFIGQYELLVAAACSGINSIISLSAISLFYIYMRHQAHWQYALLLVLLIVPVALVANFFRVLILILLTYHAGEAAAQGFLHNFAGILMFAIALMTIFALDIILKPLWDRYIAKTTEPSHG